MALVSELTWAGGTNTSDQINQKVQEMVDSGEIAAEGWAIVKVGYVSPSAAIAQGSNASFTIDVSEFGFTSLDDYCVIPFTSPTTNSTGWQHASLTWSHHTSTATSAHLSMFAVSGNITTNLRMYYAVVSLTKVVPAPRVKSVRLQFASKTIAAGAAASFYLSDLTLPSDLNQVILTTVATPGPNTWGNSLPAVSVVAGDYQSISVRAYVAGNYAPQVDILYI